VRREPEQRGERPLVGEAHPPDAQAFGAGGEPEVLHGPDRGVRRRVRLGVAAQHVPATAGGVAGDGDVQRRVEDRLDLDVAERGGPRRRQRRGVGLPGRGDVGVHPLPDGAVAQHEEVPRLGEPDRRCRVRGLQHAVQRGVLDGHVREEPGPHVAPRVHDVVERL
jgi:hypothetical protein